MVRKQKKTSLTQMFGGGVSLLLPQGVCILSGFLVLFAEE